jgi:hypothetical protein
MARKISIQPVNSIIFISDGGVVDVPADKIDRKRGLVAASQDCLIICVNSAGDGPTELTVGAAKDADPGYTPSFVGMIETRNGRIVIDQVDDYVIHDQVVDGTSVTITAWFSHPEWPKRVFIGID